MQNVQTWFEQIIGKSLKEANSIASAKGWKVRALVADGEQLFGTMDYDLNRANVRVENGVVTSIIKVG